jgi:two-component system response regulator FixJ
LLRTRPEPYEPFDGLLSEIIPPQAGPLMAQAVVHVVDDDAAVRDSLALLLEAEGLAVATYVSGDAFLSAVAVGVEGCVLADVQMPGLDGLALMECLRARGLSLPVVLMTGRSSARLAADAARAGVVTVLDKPFTSETLLAALRPALG